MLEVRDLRVGYGGVPALQGVTVTVGDGEAVALIGPNGAGKTTLLKAVCRTVVAQSGTVLWCGRDLSAVAPHKCPALGIVHVPEGRRVFPSLSVRENLLMGAYRRDARRLVVERLELVEHLFPALMDMLSRPAASLSGGQQQMLAIGRGVMACPRLMLLDEPSMGLAPLVVEQIFDGLSRLRRTEQMAMVLVEQRAREALELCDRGYVLESGRIVLQGPAAELLTDQDVAEAYLGKG